MVELVTYVLVAKNVILSWGKLPHSLGCSSFGFCSAISTCDSNCCMRKGVCMLAVSCLVKQSSLHCFLHDFWEHKRACPA